MGGVGGGVDEDADAGIGTMYGRNRSNLVEQ